MLSADLTKPFSTKAGMTCQFRYRVGDIQSIMSSTRPHAIRWTNVIIMATFCWNSQKNKHWNNHLLVKALWRIYVSVNYTRTGWDTSLSHLRWQAII